MSAKTISPWFAECQMSPVAFTSMVVCLNEHGGAGVPQITDRHIPKGEKGKGTESSAPTTESSTTTTCPEWRLSIDLKAGPVSEPKIIGGWGRHEPPADASLDRRSHRVGNPTMTFQMAIGPGQVGGPVVIGG